MSLIISILLLFFSSFFWLPPFFSLAMQSVCIQTCIQFHRWYFWDLHHQFKNTLAHAHCSYTWMCRDAGFRFYIIIFFSSSSSSVAFACRVTIQTNPVLIERIFFMQKCSNFSKVSKSNASIRPRFLFFLLSMPAKKKYMYAYVLLCKRCTQTHKKIVMQNMSVLRAHSASSLRFILFIIHNLCKYVCVTHSSWCCCT